MYAYEYYFLLPCFSLVLVRFSSLSGKSSQLSCCECSTLHVFVVYIYSLSSDVSVFLPVIRPVLW